MRPYDVTGAYLHGKQRESDAHSLPFHAIEAFPSLGDSCIVTYADAAGEGEWAAGEGDGVLVCCGIGVLLVLR